MAAQNQHLIRKRGRRCRKAALLPVRNLVGRGGTAPWKNTKSPEESLLLRLPAVAARIESVNLGETKGISLEAGFWRMASSVGTKSSEGWKQTTEGVTSHHFSYQTFISPRLRGISKPLWSSHLFCPEMKELAMVWFGLIITREAQLSRG